MSGVYEKIIEFANNAAKLPGVKKMLKPIYYPLKEYMRNRRNKQFKNNAYSVLSEFTSCLERNNIPYTLAFGTLLGGIREKGFIKHDLDIDLAMWRDERPDNLPQMLSEVGFKLEHAFLVDDGRLGLEETYTKNGVGIDIFYFFPAINKYPYCCDFLTMEGTATFEASMKKYGEVKTRRVELPMSKECQHVMFEDLKLSAPINANEILEFIYGKDYMIPNPQWSATSHVDHIVEWNDIHAIYIDY